MKGYLTKTSDKWVLTIKDNGNIPHRFVIRNLKKFCKRTLGIPYENVLQQTSNVGQFITDKLGFIEYELWELNRHSLTTPP
jgi:hypothetical protein